jgi:L-malate glycosyltransferase
MPAFEVSAQPTESASRIKLCVLGDFHGSHTRRWVQYFAGRDDFDLHLVSFYSAPPMAGATMHALVRSSGGRNADRQESRHSAVSSIVGAVQQATPRSLLHLVSAARYRRHGLLEVIQQIHPDILHSHFLVEHSFFAASLGIRPHVVTAWGSDVLVMAAQSWVEREIVRYTLKHADLVVTNNEHLSRRTRALAPASLPVETVTLGIDRSFLDGLNNSVNVREQKSPLRIVSNRSLDSELYNVEGVIRAFGRVRDAIPNARLLIAGDGRFRSQLERLVDSMQLRSAVTFLGFVPHERMAQLLAGAHVYVSVPRSDATALSTLEAMACGCFPVVSDLPSQDGLIEHGKNGLRTPVGNVSSLAESLVQALRDQRLRRESVPLNRSIVEDKGLLEPNMRILEGLYRGLLER